VLASCGYAKRDDVDAQFAQLRTEMQTADQGLDQRISQVDTKVNGLEQRAAALERDLQSLRTDFNTTIERMEGMLSFSVPVNFEFDRADVDDQDRTVLQKFADVVKGHYPNAIVTVEGFTDPVGSASYNMRLGTRRAEAVKEALVANGLQPDMVKVVSYGEASNRLITRDGGPAAGQENRRVSLVIDYTGTGIMTDRIITLNRGG
jgi:peptidoglycan-associated lipoprotein